MWQAKLYEANPTWLNECFQPKACCSEQHSDTQKPAALASVISIYAAAVAASVPASMLEDSKRAVSQSGSKRSDLKQWHSLLPDRLLPSCSASNQQVPCTKQCTAWCKTIHGV